MLISELKMQQKDYVKLKNITSYKNKCLNIKKINQTLLKLIFIIIIIIFISYLYFFIQNKSIYTLNKIIYSNNKLLFSNLPSKPYERWRYIKMLKKINTNLQNLYNPSKLNIND
ncbi:MAG: hypothetical protein ArsCj_0970 [Arsenophonus endosymbiont of Ceratovacuna japonica]